MQGFKALNQNWELY